MTTPRAVPAYTVPEPGRGAIVKRSDWIPSWDAPEASTPGTMRGICRGLMGENAAVGMVIVPAGQVTPWHDYTGEHFVVGVRGQTRFEIADETFVLEPSDALYLPAGVAYRYASLGLEESVFVNVLARVGQEWPGSSRYGDEAGRP